jgi:hypothetical protein
MPPLFMDTRLTVKRLRQILENMDDNKVVAIYTGPSGDYATMIPRLEGVSEDKSKLVLDVTNQYENHKNT